MIAISVNEDGSLNTCTCRWNHANNGNDNILNTKQISQLIGVNFYDTFKPYSNDYIIIKKQERLQFFENALEKLNQGEKFNNVFDYSEKITPYLYFISQDFTSELGALIIQENETQYQYVRNENNQIILYNNVYLINDYLISYQTEDNKSGLMKIPEFKTIATFPDKTNAYGVNIKTTSKYYNQLFYLVYQNGDVQFINLMTNKKSDMMEYPMSINFIEQNNLIRLYFTNHNTKYLDAKTLQYVDVNQHSTIVKSFFINNYLISIIKLTNEYNLLNTQNNQLIFNKNVKNIQLQYNNNLIITEEYNTNAFIFYQLVSFDGKSFQPFFHKYIDEYKIDDNNSNIFYIKFDDEIQCKYDFLKNKLTPIQYFQ